VAVLASSGHWMPCVYMGLAWRWPTFEVRRQGMYAAAVLGGTNSVIVSPLPRPMCDAPNVRPMVAPWGRDQNNRKTLLTGFMRAVSAERAGQSAGVGANGSELVIALPIGAWPSQWRG
jgi:hypothetical protein